MGSGGPENSGRLPGIALNLFVYSDAECFEEPLVLSGEPDYAIGAHFVRLHGGIVVRIVIIVPFIETDGGFQNEEDIVTGAFDLSDGFSDTFGVGKGFVDCVSPDPA